jgi:hypothetical protein
MWFFPRSDATCGPILGVVCPHVVLYKEWGAHMWSYTRSGVPTCGPIQGVVCPHVVLY